MLFWCHNAVECGLCILPAAPCTLADVGAPSARRYLDAWAARPSWAACYKTTSLFSAAVMMAAVQTIVKHAPDAVNGGSDLYRVMARARRLDRHYMDSVGAYAPRFVPVFKPNPDTDTEEDGPEEENGPVGLLVRGVPRVAVLSSRASNGNGDDMDGPSAAGPLMPFCPYCTRLCLVLAEVGHTLHLWVQIGV